MVSSSTIIRLANSMIFLLFLLTIFPSLNSEKVKELSLSSLGFNLQNGTKEVIKESENKYKKPIPRYGFPCNTTEDCLARLNNSVCITWAEKEESSVECTICNITKTCVCDKQFVYDPINASCDLKEPLKLGDPCYRQEDCLKNLENVDCVFPDYESDDDEEDEEEEFGTCECLDTYIPVNSTSCRPIATVRPTTTTLPTTPTTTTTLQTTTLQTTTLKLTTETTTNIPTTTTIKTTTEIPTTEILTTTEIPTTEILSTTEIPTTTKITSVVPSSTMTTFETSTIEITEIIDTTTEIPCDNSTMCRQFDMFDRLWEACRNQTEYKECPSGLEGNSSWYCKPDGEFNGRVPFLLSCSTRWLSDLEKEIDEKSNLTQGHARQIAGELKENLEEYPGPANNITFGGHEIGLVINLITKIFEKLVIDEGEDRVAIYEGLINITMTIGFTFFKFKNPWTQLEQVDRSLTVTNLIQMMEFTSFELTKEVTPNNTMNGQYNQSYTDEGIYVLNGVESKKEIGKTIFQFPPKSISENSIITLPDNWKSIHPTKTDLKGFVGLFIPPEFVNYILPLGKFGNQEADGKSMNGKLLSLSLAMREDLRNVTFTPDKPVHINFEHDVRAWGESKMKVQRKLHAGEKRKAVLGGAKCAYWDVKKLDWSTDGCILVISMADSTVCECTHLTSFAVLMDFHEYVGRDPTLEIITLTLCSLSIICLTMSIYIFSTVGSIQSAQTTILKNLCACLLIADMIMLTLVDRNYFHLSDVLCSITGMLSHYFFLCAFTWMAIGGWHLYKIVVFVFDTADNYMFVYRLCGYGMPVILVGLTIGIGSSIDGFNAIYGGDNFCWLKGYYIWAFMGPTAIVFTCNLFVFFVTFKKAHSARKVPYTNARVRTYKSQIFGWTSLCFLLGLTWATGYFLLLEASVYFNISAYAFTILNASQGIAIFIFNCVMNQKVRASIKRKILRQSIFDNTELSRMNKSKKESRSRSESTWSKYLSMDTFRKNSKINES